MTSYQIRLENCSITKNERYTKSLFFDLIDKFNLRLRSVTDESPYAGGITIMAILAEGSMVLHSYPYKEVAIIDYIDDGEFKALFPFDDFCHAIKELFRPEEIKYVMTDRFSFDIIECGIWGKDLTNTP